MQVGPPRHYHYNHSEGGDARILDGNPGPTHLKSVQDLEKESVIPAGFEAFGLDAQAFGLLLAQEVEGEMAEHGEIRGGVTGPDPAVVLAEGDVQRPVELVFDP